jgi:hypothetical protein
MLKIPQESTLDTVKRLKGVKHDPSAQLPALSNIYHYKVMSQNMGNCSDIYYKKEKTSSKGGPFVQHQSYVTYQQQDYATKVKQKLPRGSTASTDMLRKADHFKIVRKNSFHDSTRSDPKISLM